MIVVDTLETSHTLQLIPRYIPELALTFVVYNETTQESSTIINTYQIVDGVLKLSFDYTFAEDDKLQFKIEEIGEIVFRGKIFATTQTPQDYKLTNGLYYYE